MKKSIKNENGFTLIELLAVIVVLAIVMVIAVQAVMPRLAEARQDTFATEANTAIESAHAYFLNGITSGTATLPTNEGGVRCVTISKLIEEGLFDADHDYYLGRVMVKKVGNLYIYAVTMKNQTLMVINQGFEGNYNKDVTRANVVDYEEATFNASSSCDVAEGGTLTFPNKAGS